MNDITKAQIACNRYNLAQERVKVGHNYLHCSSCGATEEIEAGHYISTSKNSNLRFNCFNIHPQCIRCNQYLYGNLQEYRKGLIKKIGIEKVLELENAPKCVKRRGKLYYKTVEKLFIKKLERLNND